VAVAAEPTMQEYQAIPVQSSNSVPPNIMIILDNSGSMQNLAYEDYSYQGEPYNQLSGISISARADDVEETKSAGSDPYLWSSDLDLGQQHVALRFQEVNIPQGATINSARIDFVADYNRSGNMDLEIYGLAADNAGAWPDSTDNYLKDLLSPPRSGLTGASEPWNVTANWVRYRTYSTPDLTQIIQEIVDRGGWTSGNDMGFVLEGITGHRDVYSRDGSWSRRPVLYISADTSGKKYFGYFNPDYFYSFDAGLNYFVPAFKKTNYDMGNSRWNAETLAGVSATLTDADIAPSAGSPSPENGLWDGNWLNWCSMRRMDVLRKVLVGGTVKDLAGNMGEYMPDQYARDGSGAQRNVGEWQNTWWETMTFDTSGTGPAVSPYDGNYSYDITSGQIRVSGDRIPIDVLKQSTIDEADFYEGNLVGLIQRIGDRARWGNIWFNLNNSTSTNGGKVENVVNSDLMDLVHNLESKPGIGNTPLAETFYVAMQYFRQQALAAPGYPSDSLDSNSLGIGTYKDPFWSQESYDATGDGFIECAKSYVIFLTDGQPTRDGMIPAAFRDFDGDSHGSDSCTDCTSNALDDLALYAHVNDLRSDAELTEDQTLTLYTVYAFDDNNTARQLLKDAARNGGFKDKEGGTLDRPDGTYTDPPEDRLEWDEDGDAIPDTYFEASDGYTLQAQMGNAFLSIFERASSGTAASVLSTNAEGEGNSVQAYYKPMESEKEGTFRDARWLGYLQSLWLDQWGNLREDTVENKRLDEQNWEGNNTGVASTGQVDKIVKFIQRGNDVYVRKYTKHYLYNPQNGNSADCVVSDCEILPDDDSEDEEISSLKPLFEAGEVLSRRDPDTRQILTYLDANQDQVVDGGEVISFNLTNRDLIKPYLGVMDNGTWGAGGARLGNSHDDRTDNIITWIRGTDVDGLRNRTLYNVTWPLGDIIHSTPMTIGKPEERFDIIYQDPTYREFYLARKNRETMVYVGSNDGMLHAFTSWRYERPEIDPSGGTDKREMSTYVPVGTEEMGTELWAYIPQAVLPHLKWTAHKGYTHTYYVDAKPRVFDARIGDSVIPAEQWRTLMVFGLNFGGKEIDVTDDFGSGVVTRTFKPTYVCLDITEPRNPILLWERSYDNLGFAWAEPSPIRIGAFDSADPGKWFLAFGSGPTEYDGSSTRGSYMFVVDMKTGEPYGAGGNDWHSGPYDTNASFISSLAVDVQRPSNYNVDAIYFPNNYDDGTDKAKIYRMAVKCNPCSWDGGFDPDNDEPTYSDNPLDWVVSPIFESDRPIMKKLTAAHGSKQNMDHLWLYAGTGRFLNEDDKLTTDQNFVYGIQEPFFNPDHADYRNMSGPVTPLTVNQLFESNDFAVLANEDVLQGGSAFAPAPDFNGFVNYVIDNHDGWYYRLDASGGPSERIISRSTAFGRYLWVPSYTPSEDICLPGGFTQFYGFYYETGTNTAADVFGNQTVKYDTEVIGPPPPKIGVHMGREGGAKIILQQGSGAVENIDVDKFYRVGNGVADWWNEKK
jgi:type IV pilus assembly protein PilY1